jgi:hypothetical protein
VEHNEDIDDKIFALLDAADFAIIDLTYSRPSVYYEAGYAYGKGKPVVYIVRSDHFRARDEDPDGLLRVHFDLQMKNIVSWSSPNEVFRNRLNKRLLHVLSPLLREREKADKLQKVRSHFSRLSQSSQLIQLSSAAEALIKSKDFEIQEPSRSISRTSPIFPRLLAVKMSKKTKKEVVLIFTNSALKRAFQAVQDYGSLGFSSGKDMLHVELHYVFISLSAVPQSRVTGALSHFQPLDQVTFYRKYDYKNLPNDPNDLYVHVIGGVKSETEFNDLFNSVLSRVLSKELGKAERSSLDMEQS